MKKYLNTVSRALTRDEGVAGIIIAMIISIAAFSALAVFMSKYSGPIRELLRKQEASRSESVLVNAVLVNFIQNGVVVCPDTNFNGTADACGSNPTSIGTLPWAALGISRDQAIDAYGRYYTYVTISNAAARALCSGVTSDYSSDTEYTGETITSTALELRLTTQTTAGEGRYVPFAIISHGKNGAGGRVNATTTIAGADGFELANVNAASPVTDPDFIYSGPYNSSADAELTFDDSVEAPTVDRIKKMCEDLSPGGAKNATLGDDFNTAGAGTGGFNSDKWDTAGISGSQQTGGQAQFTGTEYLATLLTSEFSPAVRPLYVSAYWTPGLATNAFSIVTRATGDGVAAGITFLFSEADGISISETTTSSAGTLDVIANEKYFIEVYDNGSDVWARATQVSDPSNTATHRLTNTNDLTGEQRVLFKNGAGTNLIDDVLIGYPMLALDASSTGYATADNDGTNGTTGDLTLEAWVNPRDLTGTGYIISQWDGSAASSFRLYRSGSAAMLSLRDSGGQQADFDLGITLQANTWTHVAVTYAADAGNVGTVRSYKDGEAVRTLTSANVDAALAAPTLRFRVGADSDATVPGSMFTGGISDVRVWQSARSAANIARCYQRRLAASGNCSGASTNWRLEPTATQGFTYTVAAATPGDAGSVQSGAWAPSMSVFFRATSEGLCDGFKAGAYRCDYRVAGLQNITLPDSVLTVYAKAWGGGGGDATTGGGSAFAGTRIDNTGAQIDMSIGDGGVASGAAGENSTVEVSATTIVLAEAGGATTAGDAADSTGTLTVNGAVPDAARSLAPNLDPHYNVTGAAQQDPGRGGTGAAGNPGAIVLFW